MTFRVTGVAIGEWNKNCKIKNSRYMTIYKILRAYFLGAVSHKFEDGNYIVRYFNINILVSKDGAVLTVWRDNTRPFYSAVKRREVFDSRNISMKSLTKMCDDKHKNIDNIKVFEFNY